MKTKRLLSIILAMLMLGSIFSGLTVSAAGTDSGASSTSGKIYFEKPNWAGTIFYAHIFETNSGTAFWGWQLKKEKLEDEDGKLAYDLTKLNESTQLKGGLKAGTQYSIMFSDNTGNETCSLMFNTNCIGDTVKVTSNEKTFENAVDSTKHSYPISWEKNAKKYGIPLQITSVGTVQGEFIYKGTKPSDIINQWDKDYKQYPNRASYSPQSSARDHKTRLAELTKEFARMASNGNILLVGGGVYKDNSTPSNPSSSKNKLVGIIVSGKYKKTYVVGQKFSKKGLVVTAYYSNGTSKKVSNYKVKGYNSKAGTKYIEVSYGGKKAYFEVKVVKMKVSSIAFASLPKKTTYKVGQSLEKKGLVVYARYNNGTMKKVSNYKLSYNFNKKGKQAVKVTYSKKSAYFVVTVK